MMMSLPSPLSKKVLVPRCAGLILLRQQAQLRQSLLASTARSITVHGTTSWSTSKGFEPGATHPRYFSAKELLSKEEKKRKREEKRRKQKEKKESKAAAKGNALIKDNSNREKETVSPPITSTDVVDEKERDLLVQRLTTELKDAKKTFQLSAKEVRLLLNLPPAAAEEQPTPDDIFIPIGGGFKTSNQTRIYLQELDDAPGPNIPQRIQTAMREDALLDQCYPDEWLQHEDHDEFVVSINGVDTLPPEALQVIRWVQYLCDRGLVDQDLDPQEEYDRLVYMSLYMSYPMTLAYVWNDLIEDSGDEETEKPKTIGILGADLEMDHLQLWQELPFLKVMDPIMNRISFHFVGPEVVEAQPESSFDGYYGIGNVEMTQGLVQDAEVASKLDNCDAFVMFQPGAGTNPNYRWKEAIELLLQLKRPILVTAHDEADAKRDHMFWRRHLGSEIVYKANPWASCPYEHLISQHNGYFGIFKP